MCYSLRLTPSKIDPSGNPMNLIHMINSCIGTYKLKDYALGFEKLNKYGEATAPHFHFNFLCDSTKEAIAQWVRRYPLYNIKGNAMYSLSRHPDPDDYYRWFRYVFKERSLRKHCKGFTTEEMDKMELLAKDERARSVKFNVEKREQLIKKSTLYERYAKKLDKLFPLKKIDYKKIWLKLLSFYVEDKKAVNPQTIKGYTWLYLLKTGVLSNEQFYEENHRSSNYIIR